MQVIQEQEVVTEAGEDAAPILALKVAHIDEQAEKLWTTVRLEMGDSLATVIIDTGCKLPAVIEEKMVETLGLGDYACDEKQMIQLANGARVMATKMLNVPVRHGEVSVTLKFTVLPELPTKILLGRPGLQQLKLLEKLEKVIQPDVKGTDPKN